MASWSKTKGITEKDRQIFHFLWRWKISSTTAIHLAFSPDKHPYSTYYRLKALCKQGYLRLESVGESASRFGWTLTARSFKVIRPLLPEDTANGFRSEAIEHDFLVSAIHLGPCTKETEGLAQFTEQELRNLPKELYPDWVPSTDLHRPDGYWGVLEDKKMTVVALEVERTVKSAKRYQEVADFYEKQPGIMYVVWAVETPGELQSIRSSIEKFTPKLVDMHQFTLVSDIRLNGWSAQFRCGLQSGKTLASLLTAGFKTPLNLKALPGLNGSISAYKTGVSETPPKP